MADTIAPSRRVVMQFSAHRVDVLVPDHLRVADALRSVGVDPTDPTLVVVRSDGSRLDLDLIAGDALQDGAMLHISAIPARRVAPHASRVPDGASSDAPAPLLPQVLLVALAGVCAFLVVLVSVVPDFLPSTHLSTLQQLAVAGLFLAAALALAMWPRVRQGDRNEISVVVATVLACAGGASATDASLVQGHQAALLAGMVTGAAVAALAAVRAKASGSNGLQVALVLSALFGLGAAVTGVTLYLELPAWATAAVLLALVPPGLRILPAFALRVPVVYLVDAEHVTRTALSVRGGPAQPSPSLRNRVVENAVGRGDRLLAAGIVALSAMAALLTPFVLFSSMDTATQRVAAIVLVLLVAFALVSIPRSARNSLAKSAPRAAAAAILLTLMLHTSLVRHPESILGIACGLVVVGLVIAFVAVPVSRGRRSVGLSRLADGFEGLSVTMSLPAALVTIGTIELVRSAFSG